MLKASPTSTRPPLQQWNSSSPSAGPHLPDKKCRSLAGAAQILPDGEGEGNQAVNLQAAFASIALGLEAVAMLIWRGFIASGTSRTRET
jgi:hypothetical protein